MDISFSAEDEAFRAEVRAFLDANLTEDLKAVTRGLTSVFVEKPEAIRWQKILHKRGWVAPNWPVEYGGTGWTDAQRYIFEIELARAEAPPLIPMGLKMVAPVIMKFGRQDQKDFFLPPLLAGDHYWCQGYSEPGSGSDLASLKTRAESDGDDYLINGSKIWTTHAHYADWIFCLVRTDSTGKPQEGITFLLIDMKTPGISIRPLVTMAGDHEVNQVFFDNVRVPKANRIGDEGKGWTYAKYLLEFERGGSYSGRLKVALEGIRRVARAERDGDGALLDDASFRAKLDEAEIELLGLEMTEHRIMAALSKGGSPGPESSLLKTRGSETQQRLTEIAMEAIGKWGLPFTRVEGGPRGNTPGVGPDYAGRVVPHYLNTRAASIYGGSNEVQRNIMAKLVLGL